MRTIRYLTNRGSVLLMILVMLGVFMVMLMGGAKLISTQSTQTVNQEEREALFQVSEAGIQYAEWLLNVVGRPTAELVASPPGPQTISDPTTNRTLGTFTLTFTSSINGNNGPRTITVTSVGQDARHPTLQQTIVAQFVTADGTVYSQTSWDHRP